VEGEGEGGAGSVRLGQECRLMLAWITTESAEGGGRLRGGSAVLANWNMSAGQCLRG